MKLQGLYGEQKEIKAKDVVIGTILKWNFGYTSEVIEIKPCGKQSVYLTTKSENGKIYTDRYRKNRILAVA